MKKELLPPNFLFIYLILAIILYIILPIKFIVLGIYRLFGIFPVTIGIAINIWTDNLFKKRKTTVKPYQIPTKLITEGPFRVGRHPMYLGFVLILLGISIMLGSLTSFIAPILMFVTLDRKFIPLEEMKMEKYFKKKYLEYKTRVRRWV